jgi:DNA polymerase-3 subunit beta
VKFRVEREAWGEAVAWAARALPTRPVVPVLSGLLLRAGDDGLTVSCFDYEVSARIVVAAEVAEPGSALVPGRLLAEITRSLPGQPVELSFGGDADMVSLSCGGAEFSVVSLPMQDYPALPEPPEPAGTVDGGTLAAAALQVVPSASRDDTLPMLTAVCLEIDGQLMTLAATDRYRLAVRDLAWEPVQPGVRAAALVPARTLADVARTMTAGVPVTVAFGAGDAGQADGNHDAAPRPAEGMISFEGGGRRLTARLIGGEFIRYRSRFPADFSSVADLPATSFIEAVRRVALVADRASPVRLSFGGGQVTVEAATDGRARAVESVPADFSGDERVIAFNPHYLLDGLTAAALPAAASSPASAGSGGETGDSGAGAAGSADGHRSAGAPDGATSAAQARVRLQFNSQAKPALITSTREDGARVDGARVDGARGDSDPEQKGLRYLVVPLRVPAGN